MPELQQREVDKYIVSKYGEILDTTYVGDHLSLTRETQVQYINDHLMKFNEGKTFVKIYDEVVPLLEKYLTHPEFRLAIILTPHVSYEDCIIRETMDRRSKILGLQDLADIHGYDYGYIRKIMAGLKNKGVIGRHDSGTVLPDEKSKQIIYTVNPYIYFRGNNINKTIFTFYANSGWEELLTKERQK